MTSRAGEPARASHPFTSGGRPPGLAGDFVADLEHGQSLGKGRANSKARLGFAGLSEDNLQRGGSSGPAGVDPSSQVAAGPMGEDPIQPVTNEGPRRSS